LKPLIQEIDRAIERGWANGGHLAVIRELAAEALGIDDPADVYPSRRSTTEPKEAAHVGDH
jgi:hypothetical protein